MKDKDHMTAAMAPDSDPTAVESDGVVYFTTITRDIRVSVRSVYLEDQSQPDERHYLWAYRIRIENQGGETVRLLGRTWRIIDATGHVEQVKGEGVVGEQPQLAPEEAYEYTSGTPLATPTGFMSGHYHMVATESGERFDVAIPAFSLDSPHQTGIVH
jgi:ApaG protein